MNHYLGQKFCLGMSLKPGTEIPQPCTVHELLIREITKWERRQDEDANDPIIQSKYPKWILSCVFVLSSFSFRNLAIVLEMQHTDGIHAFKMADKITRKMGHRQVFPEYVNKIADNSRDSSFLFDEYLTKIALASVPSNKKSLLTN